MDPSPDGTATPTGERKHATVLFSDVSGFTALSEALDPEDSRDIVSRILGEAAHAVETYGGRVEKLMGDAIMAVFGVPTAHEDDPVRALRAALDIHSFVDGLSEEILRTTGHEIRMHSGLNTGLVLTGEMDPTQGSESLLGDAVNVASRLTSIAGPGEIVVGEETWRRARGVFEFEELGEQAVKGRAEVVRPFRLVPGGSPVRSAAQASRRRSRLVGREQEMRVLREALDAANHETGSVVTVRGDAGTGKSRLVAEFRDSLSGSGVAWHEGRTFSYAQSIPYFLFRNLLGQAWDIAEGDNAETVRAKIDAAVRGLVGQDTTVVPYVSTLFGVKSREVEELDPETARTRIEGALEEVVRALTAHGTTVIHFEDLHWADTSSLGVVRRLLDARLPGAAILCVSRPSVDLLHRSAARSGDAATSAILLSELTEEDSRAMLASMLDAAALDDELCEVLLRRAEGNPFFLEETVNSLLEQGLLVEGVDGWSLAGDPASLDIPTTVQGVIAARVDRLPSDAKHVLGEASVIGRRFHHRVLEYVSESGDGRLESSLRALCDSDLIKPVGDGGEREYAFRHVLMQDVVYDGLLRSDRARIHERVGEAIESLFSDRLGDFDEVLALHFSTAASNEKALGYLMASGKKALARYALDDAHDYYARAYDLLDHDDRSIEEDLALLDVANQWGLVHWYKQENDRLLDLLAKHRDLAESGIDPLRSGIYLSWLGLALWACMRPGESYEVLHHALELGLEANDPAAIGYAHARLAMLCSDIGLLDEGAEHGDRAMAMSLRVNDGDLYSFARCYAAVVWLYKGDIVHVREIAEDLLDYAERHAHGRSLCMGYFDMGLWCLGDGDNVAAVDWFRRSVQVSEDPFYRLFPSLQLGMACLFAGLYDEAEAPLAYAYEHAHANGFEYLAYMAAPHLASVQIAQGHMAEGMRDLEHARDRLRDEGCLTHYAIAEMLLGSVFAEMATSKELPSLREIVGNLGFLVRYVPRASRLAEEHLRTAAGVFEEIGSAHLAAWTNLALAEFLVTKRRSDEARALLEEAIPTFDACGIETDGQKARALLRTLV